MTIDRTLAERLAKVRKALKLTQSEFGARIGVKAAAVSNWENGSHDLPEARFRLICSIFNVNPDWLQNGDGRMFSEASLGSDDSEIEVNAFIESALRLLSPITPDKLQTLNRLIDMIRTNGDEVEEE